MGEDIRENESKRISKMIETNKREKEDLEK